MKCKALCLLLAMLLLLTPGCANPTAGQSASPTPSAAPENPSPAPTDEGTQEDSTELEGGESTPAEVEPQTLTYTNPVIWADVPDLDIIRVDDAYYMVSTTMHFSPGCPVMKS